jgi:hypothetical protein
VGKVSDTDIPIIPGHPAQENPDIDVEVNESHATCLVPASQDTFS